MERAERVWPDERSWTIQVLAGYLHVSPSDLLPLFQHINQMLQTERDQVFPEDLRLLKAHCERQVANTTKEHLEDKRRAQKRARRTIQFIVPKIAEMIAKRDFSRALNSYKNLIETSGEYAIPEEKAQWYEEMGRLSLKINKHPNEAARYFRFAVSALSLLEDRDGIQDLLDTYDEEFSGETARCSWLSVVETGRVSLEKLNYTGV